MKIICLVGMPGSGKGEINKILEKTGVPVVVMSSVVKNEVKKRGLELNMKNLDTIALDLRQNFGKDVVAKKIAEMVKKIKSNMVCVDGIRNPEEIEILKTVGEVEVVAIEAPENVRFQRLLTRGEDRDPKNLDEFRWREQKQLEIGLGKVLPMADYKIINDSSLEELNKKVIKFLADIRHV